MPDDRLAITVCSPAVVLVFPCLSGAECRLVPRDLVLCFSEVVGTGDPRPTSEAYLRNQRAVLLPGSIKCTEVATPKSLIL